MKFFLGKDDDEKNDSGSDSEASVAFGIEASRSGKASLFLQSFNDALSFKNTVLSVLSPVYFQDDGPTARDLMVRYSTGKKGHKNKQKLEKAMKVLKVCWQSSTTDILCFLCLSGLKYRSSLFMELCRQYRKTRRRRRWRCSISLPST